MINVFKSEHRKWNNCTSSTSLNKIILTVMELVPLLIVVLLQASWCFVIKDAASNINSPTDAGTLNKDGAWNRTRDGHIVDHTVQDSRLDVDTQTALSRIKRNPGHVTCPLGCICKFTDQETFSVSCDIHSGLGDEIPVPENASQVKNLVIVESYMKAVPKNLCTFSSLRSLDFSGNEIENINPKCFACLSGLINLNISRNQLSILSSGILDGLAELESVDFSHNWIAFVQPPVFLSTWLVKLKYVHLEYNRLPSYEAWGLVLPQLDVFNMSHNWMNGFTNKAQIDLERAVNRHATLDASHNNFTKLTEDALKKYYMKDFAGLLQLWKYRFDFTHNPFVCDCELYPLGSVMDQIWGRYIDDPIFHLTCENPPELRGKQISNKGVLKWMHCDISQNCPVDSHCSLYPSRKTTVVKADRFSVHTELPEELPLASATYVEMIFMNVSMERVSQRPYFTTNQITRLDVSNNVIGSVSHDEMEQLLTIDNISMNGNRLEYLPNNTQKFGGSKIDLRNNPFKCACNMTWVSDWIEDNADKVVGGKGGELSCYDSKKQVYVAFKDLKMTFKDQCQEPNFYILLAACLGGVLFLVIIGIVLVCKFHHDISVLLFDVLKGKCQCLNREKLDCTKLFDVSLVCSNEDIAKVRKNILPILEKKTPPFIVCIGERDYLFCNDKNAQIITAEERSSCTLAVLSENFIKDPWCLFQFQQAFRLSVKEKAAHTIVVVVIAKDLNRLTKSLSKEMKAYLSAKKYMQLTDRLFEKKLLYALPHTTLRSLWRRHRFRPRYPAMFKIPPHMGDNLEREPHEGSPLLPQMD